MKTFEAGSALFGKRGIGPTARALGLLALYSACLIAPLSADDRGRFALVIGNASYDGDAKLANPINDAVDIAAALRSIGWNATLLTDADRRAMNRGIADFRDRLAGSKGSDALVYYAGHGIQMQGQNYLIPLKMSFERADDVVSDAVSLQTIYDAFAVGEAASTIVILDACRDNPFAKQLSRSAGGGGRGLTVVSSPTGASGNAVLFATAPGQTAIDGTGRNGLFTQVLLTYLTADLKLQDMVTKVTGDVKRLSGGVQVPYNSMSFSDDYYLKPLSMRTAEPPVATESAVTQSPATATPQAASVPGTQAAREDYIVSIATLAAKRDAAAARLQKAKKRQEWVPWADAVSWTIGAVGGTLSIYAVFAGSQTYADYQSATTASALAAAHERYDALTMLFNIGLGTIAGGASAGIGFLFVDANPTPWQSVVDSLDAQIRELQEKRADQ